MNTLRPKSLAFALSCLVAASPGGCAHAAELVSVDVPLLGSKPFCVYDLSWEIEGLRLPYSVPPVFMKCTPATPNKRGLFADSSKGSYSVSRPTTALRVSYRRGAEGPLRVARFDMSSGPAARVGYSLAGLSPTITEDGVVLRATYVNDALRAKGQVGGYTEDVQVLRDE